MQSIDRFIGGIPAVKCPVMIPDNAKISKLSREIIIASNNHPKIKDYTDKNFIGNKITDFIGLAFFYVGIKQENMHPEDLKLYFLTVVQDIDADFSFLTLQEVDIAFKLGVRNLLGPYMGMNPQTFYLWLRTYVETKKFEAQKEFDALQKKEIPISVEQKNFFLRAWHSTVMDAYDTFNSSGEFNFVDLGGLLYKRMKQRGLLKFPFSVCKQIWEQAKENLIRSHNLANARNISERNEFKLILESVKGELGNKDARNKIFLVKKEFHRLAIIRYWKWCTENKFDFKENFQIKKFYEKTGTDDKKTETAQGIQP